MKRFKIIVIAAVAVLGAAALGGAAVRANATTTSPSPNAATTLSTPAEAPEAAASTSDTDNVQVQEGDQNGPDGAEATDKAEAAGEQAGSEVPGNDGPGGHADEPGNANADHQFEGAE